MVTPWGLVASALRPALSATHSRVRDANGGADGTSGPATPTDPRSSASGNDGSTPDALTARAVRVCNRNPDLIAAYLDRHQTLRRGR